MAERVPRIEIVEQPAESELRFRYQCENRASGALMGENWTSTRKTYPTIRMVGYAGTAKVAISLVTVTEPYRQHPNKIIYKNTTERQFQPDGGAVLATIRGDEELVLEGISIMCVRKKDIVDSLKERRERKFDPFGAKFEHIKNHADIALSSVRLAFQLIIDQRPVHRIVSNPIHDKKVNSKPNISYISANRSSAMGGEWIMLFCDKVRKEDIAVEFLSKSDAAVEPWATISGKDLYVHHQTGIRFATPAFPRRIDNPVENQVRLMRPSDKSVSEPKPFFFHPAASSLAAKTNKRAKISANTINMSNISIRPEDTAKVKRNKVINYNINSENVVMASSSTATAAPAMLPNTNQNERTCNPNSSYASQRIQFHPLTQTFQTDLDRSHVVRQEANCQATNTQQATCTPNMYQQDNRNFMTNAPQMMPQQNIAIMRNQNGNYHHHNPINDNINPMSFNDGAYGPVGSYPAPDYDIYSAQPPPPTQATAVWRPPNDYYRDENNYGQPYMNNGLTMNYNGNHIVNQRPCVIQELAATETPWELANIGKSDMQSLLYSDIGGNFTNLSLDDKDE